MPLRGLALLILLTTAAFGCSSQAAAGPIPRHLAVDLDFAKSVVIGRLTTITKTWEWQPNVEEGSATIKVSRTLKGTSVKTLEVTCPTKVLPGYGGSLGIRPSRIGDSGIWVVPAEDRAWANLLPEKNKPDVERILRQLAHRKWSTPVNGLRAWAAAVFVDYSNLSHPVVVFAVKNVSKSDIFVPMESAPGFVTATATKGDEVYVYPADPKNPTEDWVFCQRLSPGEIRYLHPNYSSIDLKWKLELPDGQYSAVVTCKNTQKQGIVPTRDDRTSVIAWTGELSAPAVQLKLETKPVTNTPGGPYTVIPSR